MNCEVQVGLDDVGPRILTGMDLIESVKECGAQKGRACQEVQLLYSTFDNVRPAIINLVDLVHERGS